MLYLVGEEDSLKKTKNNLTGIVHGLNGKKVGPLELHETICGISSGLFWLKSDDNEPITCMKCRSVLPMLNKKGGESRCPAETKQDPKEKVQSQGEV